jgi:hypothetical protein
MDENRERALASLMAIAGRIAQIDETIEALSRRRADLVRARAELTLAIEASPKEQESDEHE